jgi:hypothetical protein
MIPAMRNRKRAEPKKLDAANVADNSRGEATRSPDSPYRPQTTSVQLIEESLLSTSPREWGKALNDTASVGELVQCFERLDRHSRIVAAQIGEKFLQSFKKFNIDRDIERLEKLGVKRSTLTLAMFAIGLSKQFDDAFKEFGDKRTRDRQKRALLAPIPALRDMKKLFGELPDESMPNTPHPAKAISELEMWAAMPSWGEKVYEFFGTSSLYEVSRFALASLVYDTTGKYLDREVSSLTAAALHADDYDETRHRVWRVSNYKRLQATVPIATRLLIAVNKVASPLDGPD